LTHDTVNVTHHADRRFNHGARLRLAPGPGFLQKFAFLINIEALDDSFDTLFEARTGCGGMLVAVSFNTRNVSARPI